MDLKYRILWFDDQPAQASGTELYIRNRLDQIGLSLDITWVDNFEKQNIDPLIAKLRNYSPYDLILVDFDLGARLKGDVLLRKLRTSTNGEMVFYSAAKTKVLRQLLVDQNVDGVYCLCRDQRLGGEIFSIVESTIRRFFHPNYMRGIVVGSVSEIETIFTEMIMKLLSLGNMPTEDEVKNGIVNSMRAHMRAELLNLDEAEKKPLVRLLGKSNLHIKINVLQDLLNRNGSRIALSCLDVLSNFLNEINAPRIEFAHAKTEEEKGLPVFKERGGKVWSAQEMKALLLNIRRHKTAASTIKDIDDE